VNNGSRNRIRRFPSTRSWSGIQSSAADLRQIDALLDSRPDSDPDDAEHDLKLYLQPIGLQPVRLHPFESADDTVLPLAGGAIGFAAIRVRLRPPAGPQLVLDVAVGPALDWAARRAAKSDGRVSQILDRLRASRPALAGITLDRPRLMGVLNVTPDSFSDGGDFAHAAAAFERGQIMMAEGADIIDVGGESTRPGATPVAPETERERVLGVIENLSRSGAVVSIDTRRPKVMAAAIAAGASIINDVSALSYDPASLAAAAKLNVPVVLMHMQMTPKTMQAAPHYDDALLDIYDALAARVTAAIGAGIPRAKLVVDPGIGFGKTVAHNLELLRGLALLHGLGCPVLVGVSRKSFLGRLTGTEDPRGRLPESLVAGLWALGQGAQILRVHDVGPTRRAIAVWGEIGGIWPSP
jgi:dihydropteroate synthase